MRQISLEDLLGGAPVPEFTPGVSLKQPDFH